MEIIIITLAFTVLWILILLFTINKINKHECKLKLHAKRKIELKDICENIEIKTKMRADFAVNPYIHEDVLDSLMPTISNIVNGICKKLKYPLLKSNQINRYIYKN